MLIPTSQLVTEPSGVQGQARWDLHPNLRLPYARHVAFIYIDTHTCSSDVD
ncbi:MAG: hypothetical protein V7606_3158 [Burkholderiales bacterium]